MLNRLVKKLKSIFSRNKSIGYSRELYIGNINYQVKPYELRKLFDPYGEIESFKIIRDPNTKRSKGYGFVKFYNQKDAESALKGVNSTVYKGRELCIDYAKDNN